MSDIAIIGIGEVPTARLPERTRWDIIYDTCVEAIRDSGLGKDEIHGVVSLVPVAQPTLANELAFGLLPERLGLKGVRDCAMVNAGGASSSNAVRLAEQWITSGVAESVLIHHVTVHSTIPVAEQINAFARAGVDMQWEYPFGPTYNIIMGLIAARYMYETGATAEEMASVVTALRSWAEHDPHSLFYGRPAPSVEEVLASDMINTPLHKRESNVLADGGAALVVVSAQRARELGVPAAFKLGESARYFSGTCVGRDFHQFNDGLRVTGRRRSPARACHARTLIFGTSISPIRSRTRSWPSASEWHPRDRVLATSRTGACRSAETSLGRRSVTLPVAVTPAPVWARPVWSRPHVN